MPFFLSTFSTCTYIFSHPSLMLPQPNYNSSCMRYFSLIFISLCSLLLFAAFHFFVLQPCAHFSASCVHFYSQLCKLIVAGNFIFFLLRKYEYFFKCWVTATEENTATIKRTVIVFRSFWCIIAFSLYFVIQFLITYLFFSTVLNEKF